MRALIVEESTHEANSHYERPKNDKTSGSNTSKHNLIGVSVIVTS